MEGREGAKGREGGKGREVPYEEVKNHGENYQDSINENIVLRENGKSRSRVVNINGELR